MNITINGKNVEAMKGETILDVARRENIDIPTLCTHAAVENWGGCRLCVVEIEENGRKKIVPSCVHPVSDGVKVETKSDRVIKNRKMILSLLMARAPDAKEIKVLAKEYGVTKSGLVENKKSERCIMCALCTRLCACQDVHAISTINRGPEKEIQTFWKGSPNECIGCLVCSKNCPTEAIPSIEADGKRKIWNKEFELEKCRVCGGFASITKEQGAFYAKKTGMNPDYFNICDDCSRNETAKTFINLMMDPSTHIEEGWQIAPLAHHKMPEPTKEWLELQKKKKNDGPKSTVRSHQSEVEGAETQENEL